jgi:hypothetical protein
MHGTELALCVLTTAVAGCLGWGIRGVFGGPIGAMVPGALMGGAAALWLPRADGDPGVFWLLAAVGAAAFNPGGNMTYGQTLGLVHGPERARTYWWGLLGCFLKGGLWFAVGAVLLGLAALGGLADPVRVAGLAAAAAVAGYLGKRLLNYPMDPPRRYPLVYFSRRATGDIETDRPRQESWGGMLFGLLALVLYGRYALHVPEVWRLAGIGFVAGGIGFALGEVIQAWGIWRKPLGERAQPWIDWWKAMEMTFGAIGGAGIGLALALTAREPSGPMQWVPGQAGLGCVALVLWLALVSAAMQRDRTAGRVCEVPLLSGLLLLVAVSAMTFFAAPLIVCGFLLFSSGFNALRRWRAELPGGAAGNLAFIALAALPIAVLVAGNWPPVSVLVGVALSQCALVILKDAGEQDAGTLPEGLRRMRAAWLVVASFLVLTGVLWALALMA